MTMYQWERFGPDTKPLICNPWFGFWDCATTDLVSRSRSVENGLGYSLLLRLLVEVQLSSCSAHAIVRATAPWHLPTTRSEPGG